MRITVFKEHNKKVAALVGNEYAAGTLTTVRDISLKHTQKLHLEWKYQVSVISIVKEIDHDFHFSNYEFLSAFRT